MDLHIEYLKCHHGVDKRHHCDECQKEKQNIFNHIKQAMAEERVPIRRGCPNAGNPCFCSGACHEIIGYRDKMPHERINSPLKF